MTAIDDMKAGVQAYADGQLNDAIGKFEKALVQAQSAEDESDLCYNILLWLGTVNLEMWFIKSAEDLAERAGALSNKKIAREDDSIDVEFLPALLKSKRRRFDEAVEIANVLVQDRISTAGSSSVQAATALHHLGTIYLEAGRFEDAESALRRALLIRQTKLGDDSLAYADTLAAVSRTYAVQNKGAMAEAFCKRALKIREKHLEANHVKIGCSLHHLAELELRTYHVPQAEEHWRRALAIAESQLPPNHPQICTELNGLASALAADYRPKAAIDLYERSLAAAESTFPIVVQNLFTSISGLGVVYVSEMEFGKAEPLIRRALAMLGEGGELQFNGERGMVENLITTQIGQGKLVDALRLFPEQMRAKHTSDFRRIVDIYEILADFIQKNVLPQDVPPEKVKRKTDE